MALRTILLAVLLTVAVSACSPYRMDIRQGNYITQDTLQELEVGMTREQVHFLLGLPMVDDPFRRDRWDYMYYLDSQRLPDDRAYVVVWFEEDVVDRIEVRDAPGR